jgi:hypothetical protein
MDAAEELKKLNSGPNIVGPDVHYERVDVCKENEVMLAQWYRLVDFWSV